MLNLESKTGDVSTIVFTLSVLCFKIVLIVIQVLKKNIKKQNCIILFYLQFRI